MSAPDFAGYNAVLAGREEINAQLLIMRVQPDEASFDFKPGQFGVLGLLGREARVVVNLSGRGDKDVAEVLRVTGKG